MKIVRLDSQYHDLSFQFPYNQGLVAKCRALKDRIGWKNFTFDGNSKSWVFSFPHLEDVLKEFPNVNLSEEVVVGHTEWKQSQQQAEDLYEQALQPLEVEGLPLFEYQKVGVNFANTLGNVLIADEMGLGKTIQALGLIQKKQSYMNLIVCPASLKSNWAAEIKKWTGFYPIIDIPDAMIIHRRVLKPIFITNYERIKDLVDDSSRWKGQKWDTLIFDESHYLKNPKTKRSKLAKKLSKNAEQVIMLTGTPILNRPKELVSQLDILGKLSEFGNAWQFMMRYCDGHQDKWGHWDFSGASNLEELKEKMAKFTLRRTKAEVLTDLPDKLVHTTLLDMPEPKAYKDVKNNIITDIKTAKEEYMGFYKEMAGMSEIQRASYLDGLQMNEKYRSLHTKTLTMIEKLKQESARQKMKLMPEILEGYGDNKVVVFGVHKEIVKGLHEQFKGESVYIDGDVKPAQRQARVEAFQNDPSIKYIFGTLSTMAEGFTLTAASDVIFVELGWTPTLHQQAEDRCYRIGQKNTVNINYLILNNSIDEDIASLLVNKSEVIEGAIKGRVLDKILAKTLDI